MHNSLSAGGSDETNRYYPTTRWTLIVQSREGDPQREAAASELTKRYFSLVLQQFRRFGVSDPEARCNEFFSKKLFRRLVGVYDPEKGRFRALLKTALRGFIVECLRKQSRDPLASAESTDDPDSPAAALLSGVAIAPALNELDREFARDLFKRAWESLESEYREAGSSETFQYCLGKNVLRPLKEASRVLDTPEDNLKQWRRVARTRLKGLFRREVRELVLPQHVEEEEQYLISLLMNSPDNLFPPDEPTESN